MLDLNRLVAETENMLRRLIGEDIDLATVLDAMLRQVEADPGQMGQVIMNLVVNARDAMLESGRLTIRTENVTLDTGDCEVTPQARRGTFPCLSVADTGVAMADEIMQHIFEPLFRHQGTGRGHRTRSGRRLWHCHTERGVDRRRQ